MIDVTIKTLDSQNHRYSVRDDITVKQFKDHIASSVNIPADKQRLIYCGRVLQDEKCLSEYNVHEKVIHLVMRAPPPPSSRGGDRRANGTTGDSNGASVGGPGAHFRQRVRANQGPSSSGVRLQQAKSMLEKAAVVVSRLEAGDVASREATEAAGESASQNPSSSNNQPSTSKGSATEPMDTSSNGEATATAQPSSRSEVEESEGASSQRMEDQSSPSQELEALYGEMDALNSMDPPMIEGGHLMTSAIGNPLTPIVGAISNSLQGGLFQAASAAFVSALSSMGASPATVPPPTPPPPPPPPAPPIVSTTASSPTTSTTNSNSVTTPSTTSGSTSTPSTSSQSSSSNNPSDQSTPVRPPEGSQASGNHPLSGVRGITVRITNRGTTRAPGFRLEHPRCSVMVEVLDQYQDVQRRLQPYLQHYYRSMVEDRTYEDERQLRKDQLVLWRVSSALHYISHAMHAISDIMVDLRRNPPRQLRARPFIIPQPALVQAQINVGPSSDGPPSTRVLGRNTDHNSSGDSLNSENLNSSAEATAGSIPSLNISSGSSQSSQPQPQIQPPRFINMPDYLDDENGVVFMQVGPNGITIDSLSAEGSGTDTGPNPPPELIQNIMSSITSQLGMRMGPPGPPIIPISSAASSSSPPSTPGVRRVPPVHNSQATGNSGTSTTNATQTRVTPRAQQVHVTPLHVPGMGMTQFDPFLPCQSHHIRFEAARRRRRVATVQTSQSNQSNAQDSEDIINLGNEDIINLSSTTPQQASTDGQNTSTTNANSNHLSLFANLLAEIMSGRNEQESEEEQQQEQMFAQLVRGLMSEVSGSIGNQGESDSGSRQQTSLQEFLEPFSGGNLFSEGERDSIFAHLFNTVSQSLSMGDLIQLFFGDSARLNQLFEPLQQFVRERVLRGEESSEPNMDRAIDEIITDVNPHLNAAGAAAVHDGIDYVNTIHNFIRHRLHDIFNLILNHNEQSTFGSVLVSLLRHTLGEFVALSLHCFTDGAQGLERLVEGRVQSIMSGMSPSIQAWSVNTSIMQLRSMMGHLAITDDHIRRYVVSPDEGRRMGEARQNRMSPIIPVPGPRSDEGTSSENSLQESDQPKEPNENGVEVMEIDELGSVEEITTSESGSAGAVSIEEPPLSVTVGSQSWHSAVPQDWIPVITRDVERQRRGVPDTNLSDGYLCGVPLKRRKIAAQRKPHGTVQQVLQDTLRQSLRNSGVNRTLVDSVSSEVSSELDTSFATHVRCALREELEHNEDFKPEKFPKSEQKIRKKFQ